MPAFVAPLLFELGVNAGLALIVGEFVGTYGLLIGGLAVAQSQQRKAKRKAREQYNASQVDRLVNISTGVAPRELILGRVRKGGSVFFKGSTGADKTTFLMSIALGAHEMDALEGVYFNDELVTIDGSGNVTTAPYLISNSASHTEYGTGSAQTLAYTPIAGSIRCFTGTTGGPDGDIVDVGFTSGGGAIITTAAGATIQYQYTVSTSRANVRLVVGTDTQAADARMIALFPSLWTSAHQAKAVAYIVVEMTYDETAFPNGLPTVTAVIRGAKIFDPRVNYCVWSEDFTNAAWQAVNTKSVTANTTYGLDGTLTGDTLTDGSATFFDGIYQSLAVPNDSSPRCFSVFVEKTAGGTSPTFGINFRYAGGTPVVGTIRLNTDTGATAGSATGGAMDYGVFWRLWCTITNNSTGNVTMNVELYPATDFNGSLVDNAAATGSAKIWGAMLNNGTTPGPYCRTAGTPLYAGTTVWTQNPALMMRHVYQHPYFGKATITPDEEARFCRAADACDRTVTYTGFGGTPPIYRAAVVVPYGTPAADVFDDLAQAMAGMWAYQGGELFIKVGSYSRPVTSFGDSDIVAIRRTGQDEEDLPINVMVHKERQQKFNIVNAVIWDKVQDYKQTSLTPLKVAAYVTADGGVELAQQMEMPAVFHAPQAIHIAGVAMRDARDPLTITLSFKMRALSIELFDHIYLTITRYGWVSKEFIVIGRSLDGQGSVQLTLKETALSIYALDASFPVQGFATNTALPNPWSVPTVGPLTISSGSAELIKNGDGTVVSRMRVSWPAINDSSVTGSGTVEVQYRSVLSATEWTTVAVAGNETQVIIPEVQDLAWYTVRARARSKLAVGVWSLQETHQVIGKTAAPPPFDFFVVIAQPDGTRQYNFGYNTVDAQPVDWRGAAIRYTPGTVPAPVWSSMSLLQDLTSYYTNSPVEINAPLSGTYTFACKSIDTTGNESAYRVVTITLPDRRLGNVFDEFFEHTEGWTGVKTGCHVQGGTLEANDSTTWATLPATWAGWTRWNMNPTSPITYETPARDFGTVVAGQLNTTIDADGTVVVEYATSTNGTTWSAYGSAVPPFSTRYLKVRITVTATGPAPVPVVRKFSYQINAPVKQEYINDIVPTALTGSYRIGVGDIRVPLAGTYSVLKRLGVVIQDGSAGTWTWVRIDNVLTFGPRVQFRLNGTLADPALVDFFVEGY